MKNAFTYFFCLVSLLVTAQNHQIDAFTLEDGVPQSQVYELMQDAQGYIWLGTQGGGIARFDGEDFTVWNEKKGLLSNYVQAMQFVGDSLYIGTKDGLSIKNKGYFANYECPQINAITTRDATTYFATNKGVYTYFPKQKLKKVAIDYAIDNSQINNITLDSKTGTLWIAGTQGLWIWDKNRNFSKLSSDNFMDVIIANGKAYCASFKNGIFVYDLNTNKFNIINSITRINDLEINDNNLWVSTDKYGIYVVNTTDLTITKRINRSNGLPISHIRKTLFDKRNNVWIASSGGGIFKLFDNNFKHYDKETGLKGNRVYAVHSVDKDLYVSTSEEGISKIDSTGAIHHIKQDANFLNMKVKTLANTKNNLFSGTDGEGILVLHNSKRDSVLSLELDGFVMRKDTVLTRSFTDTLNTEKGFPFNWIRDIHVDKNKIWVASYSSGIARFNYNEQTKNTENMRTFSLEDGLSDLYIYDITTDAKGRLWYGTKNGALGYIFNNVVHHFDNALNVNTSIKSIVFHNDYMYVGTSGKGIWWSKIGDDFKFTALTGKKELYSDNIYQLQFDDNNHLWAGSENGIDKISIDAENTILDVVHFGKNDGFLGIETCLNSVAKDAKGNLWFGAIYGLTKYEPNTKKVKQTQKPSIYFEDIELMNKKLDSINLNAYTNTNKTLQLPPNQNMLTLYYKTVDINNPKEVQYRWKIDNNDWSNWSSDTKINIASDFGKHRFNVQSRNLSWQESDVISFNYFVETPWYKKPAFLWSLYLISGLVIGLIFLAYYKRLKRRNKAQTEKLELENHLLSLEQKALRLQMNPHFIFNVLNGIKAMSKNDTKTMNSTINKFATLLRSTLTNSRKDEITLQEEITTLKNYIEVEQLMAEKDFTYSIDLQSDLDAEEILIPPMLIQPFVENAIRHGIIPSDKKGDLCVVFSTSESFLHCEITDNGIGIEQSKKAKTKSNHQSMALQVTKERIEHLMPKNSLKIEEIKSENGIQGTKVWFKIPLETDY